MFQVNARQRIHMKNQDLFLSKLKDNNTKLDHANQGIRLL